MKNKKILALGAVSGIVVSFITKGIEGWWATIGIAIIIGSLIGLIGGKILKE